MTNFNPYLEDMESIPRSIFFVLKRLVRQLFPGVAELAVQEFRISRYRVVLALKCVLTLILVPLLVYLISKPFFITPLVTRYWEQQETNRPLSGEQQKEFTTTIHTFQKQLDFEKLVDPQSQKYYNDRLQVKRRELHQEYALRNIQGLSNFFTDVLTYLTLRGLMTFLQPQISIMKSVLGEILYSTHDSTKAIWLIFGSDLLLGYHSTPAWEMSIGLFFRHLGFIENDNISHILVGTLPVILDAIFKFWIFRTLNKISPSTVLTYYRLLE